jgi:1-deoxy-D-xylulose-5-phosphate reductoisomerase
VKKNIAILGSTGSIGRQALEVVDQFREQFAVEVLTAQNQADLLINQALRYMPNAVVIGHEEHYQKVFDALDSHGIKVYSGEESIRQVVAMESIQIVLVALVGFAGLSPTIEAIKAGKKIALANKECLVVAGELITKLALQHKSHIIPVDSEHSAIFQCLTGEPPDAVEKIILTASGGPFRNMSSDELQHVTRDDALNHPNWDMGDKITIDSATMMNKGLEVIEAKWLFGLTPDRIEVVIHPQSILHSIVQFVDGSMKAQMSLPDMRIPIQYALTYPERLKADYPRFSFKDFKELSFESPDIEKFRNLALAFEALDRGGNIPCVLNAANEVAVHAFLDRRIGFSDIALINEKCLHEIAFIPDPSLEDYLETDKKTRKLAMEMTEKQEFF